MILHVIKSNIYSGAENVVCQIIKGLSNREEFIYMAPHGPIEDKLRSIGLYHCYRGIDSLSVKEIIKAVDELHPDVVHAHDFTASVLCGFALKGKVPVVSHIHCNPLWLKNPLHPNSISYVFTSIYFKQIIAVSDAIAREYVYSKQLKCPITTLGNPFSAQQVVDMAREGLLAETKNLDADLNPVVDVKFQSDILYVGRFNQAKNPLGAIKIFEALPDKEGLVFRMIGDGELLQQCKDYVASHGLSQYIFFEGFQENVYKYMAGTNLLLMPSIFEGFGLVALEAMALGNPVICSGVGGLTDIVTSDCGYICNSTDDYVAAIEELRCSPKKYTAKAEAAHDRAAKFSNLHTYCDTMEQIYNNLSGK